MVGRGAGGECIARREYEEPRRPVVPFLVLGGRGKVEGGRRSGLRRERAG